MQGTNAFKLRPLFVGLRADGTVSTMPEDLIPAVEAWTDITDVRAGWKFIIGLRADGTAVAAGGEEYGIPGQVAQWTDVRCDRRLHALLRRPEGRRHACVCRRVHVLISIGQHQKGTET